MKNFSGNYFEEMNVHTFYFADQHVLVLRKEHATKKNRIYVIKNKNFVVLVTFPFVSKNKLTENFIYGFLKGYNKTY